MTGRSRKTQLWRRAVGRIDSAGLLSKRRGCGDVTFLLLVVASFAANRVASLVAPFSTRIDRIIHSTGVHSQLMQRQKQSVAPSVPAGTNKHALKRAEAARKQEALEARLALVEARAGARARGQPEAARRRPANMWDRLPLPFLCRLAAFLSGRELQRAVSVFRWPAQFAVCDAFKQRLRATTHEAAAVGFPNNTERDPRKHKYAVI